MTTYGFAFPCIFIVLLKVCLAVTDCFARVSVRLEPYDYLKCAGPRTVGLDDYMVRVEYRLLHSANDSNVSDWKPLFKVDPNAEPPMNMDQSITISAMDSTQGLQMRLLQLEHNAGGCNCWFLDFLTLQLTLSNTSQQSNSSAELVLEDENFTESICHSELGNGNVFCWGNGYEARGVITRALYFPGIENGERCPGNSNSSLFPTETAYWPENCSSVTPRM